MTITSKTETPSDATIPQPAATPSTTPTRTRRAIEFARRHPALTMLGAAGAGLASGIELATGVLLGAGIAALLRTRAGRTPGPAVRLRAQARSAVDHLPHELVVRTRAVVQAARGKLPPLA